VALLRGVRLPWRWSPSLTPDGLELRSRSRRRLLRWDDYALNRAGGWHVVTWHYPWYCDHLTLVRPARRWKWTHLGHWFDPVDAAVVVALVAYIAATPAARRSLFPGLNLDPVVRPVRDGPLPPLPTQPALHSGGIQFAMANALAVVWPRRFGGYPVAGEPRPTEDDVLRELRRQNSHWLAGASDSTLRLRIGQQLAIGEWPFDQLLSRRT
jgi:hypothetical protein